MAHGLPDHPPEGLEFVESLDDTTCPVCGWDIDDTRQDLHEAYGKGIVLAVEKADGSVFGSMGGAENIAIYWRCPGEAPSAWKKCLTLFTTEEETPLGAMT